MLGRILIKQCLDLGISCYCLNPMITELHTWGMMKIVKKLPSFACFGWYEKERINGVLKVYKKIRSTWDKQPYELTWICENSNNEEWYTQMRRVGAVHVSDYNSDSADVIEIIGGKWTLEVYPPEIDF